MSIVNPVRLLILAPLLMLLSACGGSGDNSGNGEPDTKIDPVTVTPDLDRSLIATATITPAGGTIETTNSDGLVLSLNIPAGAVLQDTEITITPVTDIPNLPFGESVLAGLQFAPDGLLFAEPALLTIDLPPGTTSSTTLGIGWDGAGENTRLEFVEFTDTQATIVISHFSGIAIIETLGNAFDAVVTAIEALAGNTTLQAKYTAKMTKENAIIIENICGNIDEIICFGLGGSANTEQTQNFDAFEQARQEMILENLPLWLDEITVLAPDSTKSTADYQNVTEEFISWTHTGVGLLCGNTLCDLYPAGGYVERVNLIQMHIAKGIIATFERMLTTYDDRQVLNLIIDIVLLGDLIEGAILTELGLAADANLGQELRNRYARQLLIEVQDFPASLIQGGEPVGFSVRLMHQTDSTSTPLPGVIFKIGPDNEGCALLSYNDMSEVRGLLTVTTNANGVVEGLAVAAGDSCSEPVDQSKINFEVSDDITNDSTPYLGKNLSRTASHETIRLNITDATWSVEVASDTSCDGREANGCTTSSSSQEIQSLSPTSFTSAGGYAPLAATLTAFTGGSNGTVSSSATVDMRISPDPTNSKDRRLDVHLETQIVADITISGNVDVDPEASSYASSRSTIRFDVSESDANYSLTWQKTGFAPDDLFQEFADISLINITGGQFVAVFDTRTTGNELDLTDMGILVPGNYVLEYRCIMRLSLIDISVKSATSNSGSCTADFAIIP